MKKKIVFLADSTVDLFSLYNRIKDNYEVIWIVYHKDVAQELSKKGIKKDNVFYIDPLKFLSFKIWPIILIKKIFKKLLNKFFDKILIKQIKKIDENYKPNLWITDTGSILSKIDTKSPKCTFKHSVTYKRHYLGDNISDYDYVFLPGLYHQNRIQKIHPKKINKNKLIVAGSLKVSNYVNKAELDLFEKQKFLKKNNLSIENKNILFAPTHDAHGPGRFLPNSFGNQFEAVERISNFISDKLKCNFIIKLHHYQSNLLKKKIFKQIKDKKNNMVFDLAKFHDVEESENVIRISDIIITDTSGVGPLGIFLGKEIIFLEPGTSFDWKLADLESDLRPGFICNQLEEVYAALKRYLNTQNLFVEERKNFVKKVFFQHSKDACNEISNVIDKIINNKMTKGDTIENYTKQ